MKIEDIGRLVVGPALRSFAGAVTYSDAAHALVLGTGIAESNYDNIAQQTASGTPGVARSFWQIEPATYDDIVRNFVSGRPNTLESLRMTLGYIPSIGRYDRLYSDMNLGVCFCRMVYLRAKDPLPGMNAQDMANYHKKIYNTALGAADPATNVPKFQKAIDIVNALNAAT